MPRAAAVLLLFIATVAGPLSAATVTLDFEGFPDSTMLTTQYPGVTFSNAIILTAGISLDEFDFPPHSGVNVAGDNSGPMSIAFANPVTSFSGYFTYAEPLALRAFNGANVQVEAATSVFPENFVSSGNPPNELLQVSFAGGISRVTITGDPTGGSFALDDATVTTAGNAIPEPVTLDVVLVGIILLISLRKGHEKSHRFNI